MIKVRLYLQPAVYQRVLNRVDAALIVPDADPETCSVAYILRRLILRGLDCEDALRPKKDLQQVPPAPSDLLTGLIAEAREALGDPDCSLDLLELTRSRVRSAHKRFIAAQGWNGLPAGTYQALVKRLTNRIRWGKS